VPIADSIQEHVAPAMLVMFRFGGLMIFGPLFGSSVIPVRIKVFLTLLLGLAVYPLLSRESLAGQPVELELWTLAPMVAVEIFFGAAIGFLASMPMVAAQTGGLIMGQQMGLGFAQFYNPAIDDEGDVVGQMLFLMALGGFIVVGGIDSMMLGVMHSFNYVPLGAFRPDFNLLALMSGMLIAAFEIALRVAAPLLALIFLETVAMGFVAKTVPQLNILSLGFPIRILAGIFIVAVGLVMIDQVLMESVDDFLNCLFAWIEGQQA